MVVAALVAASPAAADWVQTGSLETARRESAAVVLADGRVLAVGGRESFVTLASAELYDPQTRQWSPTGAMEVGRRLHSATVLPSGGVLVAGGQAPAGTLLASAEVWDPASGTWSPTGSLAAPRRSHTATPLADGTVLITGGDDGINLATAEVYDPADGTWSPVGSMASRRSGHTATLLATGEVLVTGHFDLATAELYDPVTKTWRDAASLGRARRSHTASLLPSGKVLVVGGRGADRTGEVYDPSTDAWEAIAPMGEGRGSHTASLLPDGRVLVAGGRGSLDAATARASTEVYDPATNSWRREPSLAVARFGHAAVTVAGAVLLVGGIPSDNTAVSATEEFRLPEPEWDEAAAMPVRRQDHTATPLSGGRVLVAGGSNATDFPLPTSTVYDPRTNAWSPPADMAVPATDHAAAPLGGGKALVAGGYALDALAAAQVYDADAGAWAATAPMAEARARHTLTRLRDGRVLAAGGYAVDAGTVVYRESAELYDPASGAWSDAPPMTTPRHSATATLLGDGRVLVAGGINADPFKVSLAGAELYDPARNEWTPAPNMATARMDHVAAPLPDGRVLVAGGLTQPLTGIITAGAEIYDPRTNAWTNARPMRVPRLFHAGVAVPRRGVLVAGGRDYSLVSRSSAELYDARRGRWIDAGEVRVPRAAYTVTALPGGRVLALGGSDGVARLADARVSPDFGPPALRVKPIKRRLRAALRRGIRARVRGDEAIAIRSQVRLPRRLAHKLRLPVVVGKSSRHAAAGQTVTTTTKLKRRARVKLAKRKAVKLQLRTIARDAAGNATIVNRTMRLRR